MVDNMKAWRIHAFGGSDALTLDDIERPVPDGGNVLVKIAATSINPVDYKTREGEFPPVKLNNLPKTLGRDVAGVVTLAGDGFVVGDSVYGMPEHDRGSYAQYIVMKPGELAALPDGIDMATAGAVPLAALTAWQGLFNHGLLTKGERVLILGGAGGVGHLAVQFAIQAGATVFATGRAQDITFLESLGVTRAIDTDAEPLSIIGEPVDLIYDLIGGDAQQEAWPAIADDGRFVSTLTEPDATKAGELGVRTAHYMARPDGAALSQIAAIIADSVVKVTIAKTFSFAEMRAAQDALEHGGVHGKIAVSLD